MRDIDGDADFLREALAALVNRIIDSEASVKAGAGHPAQRKPQQELGLVSGHDCGSGILGRAGL